MLDGNSLVGAHVRRNLCVSTCLTLKKKLFIADAPMKIKLKYLVLPPCRALLGHPVQEYVNFFCFNQKNLFTNPS